MEFDFMQQCAGTGKMFAIQACSSLDKIYRRRRLLLTSAQQLLFKDINTYLSAVRLCYAGHLLTTVTETENWVSRNHAPFPQIDIIGGMVIVWRVRGKIIRSVLCSIVCYSCSQCNAHTYEQT